MNFSICLASRERSTLLMALLESIKNTTFDIDNVEVIVGIDNCDPEMNDCKVHACRRYSFVQFFSRPRSHMLNKDYINAGYDNFNRQGKYVIACNDDVIFRTSNWDQIIISRMESYLADKPDRIAYAFLSDSLLQRHGQNYCCFPCVTREGVQALGWIMPPECRSWNADAVLNKIYSGVGRVVDISEVHLDHISYHSNKRARDQVSQHVQSISNACSEKVGEYTQRLRDAIKRGGTCSI